MSCLEVEQSTDPQRGEEDYTLWVNNLPDELNENGIAEIFKSYGEISSLFTPRNASWAYVGYKTYKEAEHAIRALNERPPLNLTVAFRKKKVPQKPQGTAPAPLNGTSSKVIDYRYADNGIIQNPDRTHTPALLANFAARMAPLPAEIHSVYPTEHDVNVYNPYENAGRYMNTNALWSRGCFSIDESGKRFVCMGRGYTNYHIPEPAYPQIEKNLQHVYEKRCSGSYQYGHDGMHSEIGQCLRCGHSAKYRCARCNLFYCSRECQVDDWTRHQLKCKAVPDLIGDFEASPVLSANNFIDAEAPVTRRNRVLDLTSRAASLRRPKSLSEPKTVTSVDKTKPESPSIDDSVSQLNSCNEEKVAKSVQTVPVAVETAIETAVKIPEPAIEKPKIPEPAIEKPKIPEPAIEKPKIPEPAIEKPKIPETPIEKPKTPETAIEKPKIPEIPIEKPKIREIVIEKPIIEEKIVTNSAPADKREISSPSETIKSSSYRPLNSATLDNPPPQVPKDAEKKIPSVKNVEKSGSSDTRSICSVDKDDLLRKEQGLAFQRGRRPQTSLPITRPISKTNGKIEEPPIIGRKLSSLPQMSISKDTFTDINVVCVEEDNTFWANRGEDKKLIASMMMELQEKAKNFRKAKELVVGDLYAIEYNKVWHRVSLLATKPSNAVTYIDFGFSEEAETDDFRYLTEFLNYPAYAMHLRLSANCRRKTVTEDSTLSVKRVGIDANDVIEVVDHDSIETPAETPKICESADPAPPKVNGKVGKTLKNTIDVFKAGDMGCVQVYVALDQKSYAVCLLNAASMDEYQMIFEAVTDACAIDERYPNFSPQIGDFVCGKRDDAWLRGYVQSLGPPVRLELVDEARVSPVERTMPVPKNYEDVFSFGCILTIDTPTKDKFDVDDAMEIQITRVIPGTKEANDRVLEGIILSDKLKDAKFTVKKWNPTPEQKGIAFAELQNNNEVCISAYSSERIMYLRGLDTASLERTHRLIQRVAKWAQTAPALTEPPVCGQLVVAKFLLDGNFYRAIVTKVQDDKIRVSYVDYGNSEITTLEHLRVLSDELKAENSCSSKVVLKDIKADAPPTKEVHQYLDLLVGKEQPLICTFEGNPGVDGVVLKTATGECVNEQVNHFLTPVWEREDPSKNLKCFMTDDLEVASLGEIGHTVTVIPLFGMDPPFKYAIAPYDQEALTHITGIMPKQMLEYCESVEHYIPRTGELCLAIWQGGWYRGSCLNRSKTPTQAVIYFVDYGNVEVVDHTNIRQMTQDFMSPPAFAVSCEIKNLGIVPVNGKVPENIQKRVIDLIPLNELIDVKILRKATSENNMEADYELELPTVRETLLAEGLVK